MSYTIISAIGKIKGSQSSWESITLDEQTMGELYKRYSTIRVTLENPYTKEQGSIILDDYENEIGYDKHFKGFLEGLGDRALPLGKLKTTLGKKGLYYHEALSAKFDIKPTQKGRVPDYLGDKYNYDDLFITREDVDPVDMVEHTMITVNGYFHPTDGNSKGLWVSNGYKTIRKRNKRCIGVISFENLGKLKQIMIRSDMLSKLNDKVDYYNECIIDIGEDCEDKTILLVIGGYLHVLDYDVFSRVSSSAIKVKLKNIPLLERIHQSLEDLDFTEELVDERYGKTNLDLEYLYSDAFIEKYLSSDYSFIILLDNNEIFKEITYPQQRRIPNNYLSDKRPILPMMTHLGKVEEYAVIRDGDKYVMETADSQHKPRLYTDTHPLTREEYRNDATRPTNRRRIPNAYFFNLLTFL